ncbi:MAG: prenyltransferase, partial [Pseudomonadota bacterium]|nr:prenyltransferase [Pseudomonadota bacterium]
MNLTSLKTVLKTTRPSFLILSPVCVLLGFSTALQQQAAVDVHLAVLVFTGAVLAHISVNTLNEYHDFKSGLDLTTIRTPFSGGSGALPRNPDALALSRVTGLIALSATMAIGAYLVHERGLLLLPIGFVGVVLVLTYTHWINRAPFLCLIAPGLGFGVLMVVGSHVTMTGEYSRLPWLVSLVPFFLLNNLLLLNQYPDINADSNVGRRTFPIVFGTTISNTVYALFFLTAYALVLYYICAGYIP